MRRKLDGNLSHIARLTIVLFPPVLDAMAYKHQIKIIKLDNRVAYYAPRTLTSIQKIDFICVVTMYRIIKRMFLTLYNIVTILFLHRS